MVRIPEFTRSGLGLAALSALAGLTLGAAPAEAVVYCKTVGVPKGCVARPAPVVVRPAPVVVGAPVVAAPAARAAVATPYRGVGAGARGVGVRPGTPANRGGPVNRVGRR
ncbi:MAG TPA: hypothetical protein VGV17_07205 [Bosea sp. (in: a-proteobacteria)]|jgi:hypothetical protein|uniref:hypothetical protein n=1 Tax=Bosea sp. (in: a-proteobacteria) TaxID=1871050 RepID=UPI002DDD6C82|nr:hypothetical protein [Bosea sp. (in: a-proteobacteria)]HEV2553525.1 hypothetical protein [Bosea sp. (in: a-proteobacteria)]